MANVKTNYLLIFFFEAQLHTMNSECTVFITHRNAKSTDRRGPASWTDRRRPTLDDDEGLLNDNVAHPETSPSPMRCYLTESKIRRLKLIETLRKKLT